MEPSRDFSGKTQVPVARQNETICIQRQPVSLIRSVSLPGCHLEHRRRFIHFIKHCDLQHLCPSGASVIALFPQEFAAVTWDLVLASSTVEVVPGKSRKNDRHV